MKKAKRNFIAKYLSSSKDFPLLAGLSAGLYPVLFFYSNNLEIVFTWGHVFYFFLVFIVVPALIFVLLHGLSKMQLFKKYQKYVLPFLSLFVFLFILKTLLYSTVERKLIVYSILLAGLFALFFYKHWKKLVVLQLLMALLASVTLGKALYKKLTYDDSWKKQPDAIENVVFKKQPNVYFFEPDGYAGFNELKNPPYNYDNAAFETFLKENNFKTYPDFHTNYITTLASNASFFTMKHHYYDFNLELEEVNDASSIILSSNPVLNAFKNNGYETYFISSSQYFILNKPKLGYNHCSIDYKKIAYLHNSIGEIEPVVAPFLEYLDDGIKKPKFFFVQFLAPWHVSSHENSSEGVDGERIKYLERIEEANTMLTTMISEILKQDPNALIVMMSDHGGYVGLTFTRECYNKVEDPVLVNSILKSNLTIHWPDNEIPTYDENMKSSVNVFRVLFSYLSENETYLNYLQPNESFIIHKKGEHHGVYKYLDDEGNIVFQKMEPSLQ